MGLVGREGTPHYRLNALGAITYICGNPTTVGKGVADVYERIIGLEELEALKESGRYVQDLY